MRPIIDTHAHRRDRPEKEERRRQRRAKHNFRAMAADPPGRNWQTA